VEALDEGVAATREALANTTDEHLMKPWRMLVGGKVVSEQPHQVSYQHDLESYRIGYC